MPELDRGTRIYATVLAAIVLGLVFLALYEPPQVSELNDGLQADGQVGSFPYTFPVLRVDNGIAVMSTPAPDVCQDTCPFVYAASSLIPVSSLPSFSGFNHTSPTGSQFRVPRLHRSGFRCFAA